MSGKAAVFDCGVIVLDTESDFPCDVLSFDDDVANIGYYAALVFLKI